MTMRHTIGFGALMMLVVACGGETTRVLGGDTTITTAGITTASTSRTTVLSTTTTTVSPTTSQAPTTTTLAATTTTASTTTVAPEVTGSTAEPASAEGWESYFSFSGGMPLAFPDTPAGVAFVTPGVGGAEVQEILGPPNRTEEWLDTYGYYWDFAGPAYLATSDGGFSFLAGCDPFGSTRIAIFDGLAMCDVQLGDLLPAWGMPTDLNPTGGEYTVAFSTCFEGTEFVIKVGVDVYKAQDQAPSFPPFTEGAWDLTVTHLTVFEAYPVTTLDCG